MDSSASDEGDPANTSFYSSLPLLFVFFLTACTQPGTHHEPPGIPLAVHDTVKAAKPKPAPPAPVKRKKKIYLTFDDGPNKGTQNVLDIVQQENIPATFFIVGEHVFASHAQARTWDSLQRAGNIELCNHSYTHAHNRYDLFYQRPDTVVKDMELTREKLLPGSNIVRAPGRNSWRIDSLHYTDIRKSKAAKDSLQKAGFVVVGWDLEWHHDPKTYVVKNSADEMLRQVDSAFARARMRTSGHLVVLAHDQAYQKPEDSLQLRQFIRKLKQNDQYELSLVSYYPGVKPVSDTMKK